MLKLNANNERLKRTYFAYLREARGRNDASIDAVAKAISRFEEATGHQDFRRFHREHAIVFKRKLNAAINPKTGKVLSRSTVHATSAGIAGILHLALRQAGIPPYTQLCGRRVFQPVREGCTHRQDDPGAAGADDRTGPPCP